MSDTAIDVRALRKRLNLTQGQLAERLGLDRSSVSRLENGQPPSGPTEVLLRLLAAEPHRPASDPILDRAGTAA
ncbi:helix-turn-helix domain-containing protein [Methylopila jiangsuensis]|uniref:helix-turn-helix domain-containing protein n=1 Tax=Methylopila jiangsuensis TaxID=586230 RepID=UPI00286C99EB|nr:helix-turn-helix domain-containing protein [Methylopila jiangsuensis]